VRHSLGLVNHHRAHVTNVGDWFYVGSFEVRPFDVVHSNLDGSECENLGFLLTSGDEKLVYIVDTSYCTYRFRGLTRILIEANFSKATLDPNLDPSVKRRLYRNHFRLENVIRFLKANDLSRVKQIFLLHLSSSNSDADIFKREVMAVTGIPTFIASK
jgi:phosphoribosyl 1,2-cyclic phosphodiesterase